MAKIVKVSSDWTVGEIKDFVDRLRDANINAIVVADDELEVFDENLENITIEGAEVLEGNRFSGDSLYEVHG